MFNSQNFISKIYEAQNHKTCNDFLTDVIISFNSFTAI